jgi:hypothetical protein
MEYAEFTKEVAQQIERHIRLCSPPAATVADVIPICRQFRPHPDWDRLASLDYDSDIERLAGWFGRVVRESPPPFLARVVDFGLDNPLNRGNEMTADMYVCFFREYDPDDLQFSWLWSTEAHRPAGRPHLRSLEIMCSIAYYRGAQPLLENDAEWPIGLALGLTIVPSLLNHVLPDIARFSREPIGIVSGFQSGEPWKLGEVVNGRFQVSPGPYVPPYPDHKVA